MIVTSTATELVSLVPQARVCDPERLRWFLQRTVGWLRPEDFQHLRSWRRGTVRLLDRTARKVETVVVPMSVLRPPYLDELLTGLRSYGHTVHHVLLDAPADVVRAGSQPTRAKTEFATRGFTIGTSTRNAQGVAAALAQVLNLKDE